MSPHWSGRSSGREELRGTCHPGFSRVSACKSVQDPSLTPSRTLALKCALFFAGGAVHLKSKPVKYQLEVRVHPPGSRETRPRPR